MRARTTTTLLIALAAGLAAGCGSEEEQGEPIPADSVAALERQLVSIENRFAAGGGACGDITGGADPNSTAVQQAIDSLPENVDPDVRQALQDGFDRLFTLTTDQCDEQQGQDTTTEEQPTETETQPTETEPPPTETEPPPTETEPPPTEEPPADEGDGDGGTAAPEEDDG